MVLDMRAYCRLSLVLGCAGYLMLSVYIMSEGYRVDDTTEKGPDHVHTKRKTRADTSNDSQSKSKRDTAELANTLGIDIVPQWESLIKYGSFNILGKGKSHKGYLTVGIPAIWRVNGMEYLLQTLSSLVNSTSIGDKASITVLVFLADADVAYNEKVAEMIWSLYREYIESGFIRVIWLPEEKQRAFYPPLDHLKRTFGDKPDRVSWRAKQAVDYAFMFYFSGEISRYYIQLEDDVLSKNGFLASIRTFIRMARERWYVLDFSELGFIGKLLRSRDLNRLAHFVLMFYNQQPVDWILPVFREAMGQRETFLCKPTLFQHVGRKSSFDISHENNLVDRYFEDQ